MSAELKEFYLRLREEEERTAPSFRQTIESRHDSSRWYGLGFPRLKVAAAIAALIVVAIPVFTHLSESPTQPGGELTMDVLEWESPTDFLLTYSEEPLLMTVPSIEIEIPDWEQEGVVEGLESGGTADDS